MAMLLAYFLLISFVLPRRSASSHVQDVPPEEPGRRAGDAAVDENGFIFISTLDGRLEAIDPIDGHSKWSLADEPLVRAPVAVRPGFTFLPNPSDGSLYVLGDGHLKKLPYTIPQFVHAAPCKSADGILYAGSKKDTWFAVDPATGRRLDTLSSESENDAFCPASDQRTLYLGRTEYHLSMFDSNSRVKKWNATFMDYNAHLLPGDTSHLGLQHMSSCADGTLIAVDSNNGDLVWRRNFSAPVVGVYVLRQSGLHRVEHMVFGRETLEQLIEAGLEGSTGNLPQFLNAFNSQSADVSPVRLYRTLYVGETEHGLYAVPSYVDEGTVTIAQNRHGPPLLDGPKPIADPSGVQNDVERRHIYLDRVSEDQSRDLLLLGHHEDPPSTMLNLIAQRPPHRTRVPYISYEPEPNPGSRSRNSMAESQHSVHNDVTLEALVFHFVERHAIKLTAILSTLAAVLITSVFWCCCKRGSGYDVPSSGSFGQRQRSAQTSRQNNGLVQWFGLGETPVPDGWMPIGKILFDPGHVLGRGCEGTVVYKGQFDGREVAVKRVVSEFLNLADREVDLLRESDSHAHVIRYYCMEADSQFRYIALELCWATLQDFVDKAEVRQKSPLSALEILRQATLGLDFLHSLKIVHRDLKPPNVLLSAPNGLGQVRAMISDFGLCKKLPLGRNSLSRRSGVAGTDGWIAPELLAGDQSVTCSADVFSLGCVYSYVLSGGAHPFGDSFRRQANIAQGEPCFDQLLALTDGPLYIHCIKPMLSFAHRPRPPTGALLQHPIFWSSGERLAFLQDVSDRVEKDDRSSVLLRRLEMGGRHVLGGDWRDLICAHLQTDLRKFRTYRGHSVRDLLRALRNKRHHYRELPDELRQSLGTVPNEFLCYFTGRFPKLMAHVYAAAELEKCEPLFHRYYWQGDFEWWVAPEKRKVDVDEPTDAADGCADVNTA